MYNISEKYNIALRDNMFSNKINNTSGLQQIK